jgi:hypothetical protein
MTTERTKKPKLPPGQKTLVDAIEAGSTLMRSCGSYWLKAKNHPEGRQWDPVRTATVSALLKIGVLKSDGYNQRTLDESFSIDPSKLQSLNLT